MDKAAGTPGPKKDVLQPVDDEARRLAKTLLRTERHGALATLEPGTGWPAASRVAVATMMSSEPIFLISRLSAHFGALEADPRAGLMLGSPGAGDPLAHPRLMVQGRAEMLAGDARATARRRFLARHPKAQLYVDFADFAFWRLSIDKASLNGGFAKAYAPTPADLLVEVADAFQAMEAGAVEHMNDDHLDAVKLYAEVLLHRPAGAWRLTGLDPEGLDMARGDDHVRLWLDPPLPTPDALRPRLVALVKQARAAQEA
ncbi:MAG: DUF2470 domain-containing protein [Pseudomonadota bacterium]